MRIIDFFDKGATRYPDNIAFVDAAGHCSYRKASLQTHWIASALHRKQFGKGAHIGILAPTSNKAFLALLGVFRAGAIWLPINPRKSVAITSELLNRLDCELLLFHSIYEEQAKKIISRSPSLRLALCIDTKNEFGESLTEWMRDADYHFQQAEPSPDDISSVFLTVGTTGPAQRVVMTHRNIAAVFANYYAHFNYYDNTRHLFVAPMTHSAVVRGCLHFARGGTNVIMSTVDPGGILQAIQEHRITHLFIPPTLLTMMLIHPDINLYDYSSLQHFLIGAAPTSLEKLKEATEVFGPVVTEYDGQSKVPSIVTV